MGLRDLFGRKKTGPYMHLHGVTGSEATGWTAQLPAEDAMRAIGGIRELAEDPTDWILGELRTGGLLASFDTSFSTGFLEGIYVHVEVDADPVSGFLVIRCTGGGAGGDYVYSLRPDGRAAIAVGPGGLEEDADPVHDMDYAVGRMLGLEK